jgi:hypothetical protein
VRDVLEVRNDIPTHTMYIIQNAKTARSMDGRPPEYFVCGKGRKRRRRRWLNERSRMRIPNSSTSAVDQKHATAIPVRSHAAIAETVSSRTE